MDRGCDGRGEDIATQARSRWNRRPKRVRRDSKGTSHIPCAWTTQGSCYVVCRDLRSWRWIVTFCCYRRCVRCACERERALGRPSGSLLFSGTRRNLIKGFGQGSGNGRSCPVLSAFLRSSSISISVPTRSVPYESCRCPILWLPRPTRKNLRMRNPASQTSLPKRSIDLINVRTPYTKSPSNQRPITLEACAATLFTSSLHVHRTTWIQYTCARFTTPSTHAVVGNRCRSLERRSCCDFARYRRAIGWTCLVRRKMGWSTKW